MCHFVLQHSGSVIPLEVKAEENLQAKSLKCFATNNGLLFGVRTSMSDYRKQDKLVYLPLYAISQLCEVCDVFSQNRPHMGKSSYMRRNRRIHFMLKMSGR